jgi:hypothetical protein
VSILLHFDGALGFQRFLRDRASHWPDWRRLRAWKHHDGSGFVLECPQAIADRVPDAVPRLTSSAAQRASEVFLLGDVWRRGLPVQRSQRAQSSPSCYLLIVEQNLKDAASIVIEQAPAGLEFLSLELEPGPGNRRVSGFLLQGDSGRMVAHAPPFGCRAYECELLPRGGIAACPRGWSPPNLSEELWPASSDTVIIYSITEEKHTVTLATIVTRQPVANLVTGQSEPELALMGVDERMVKTPWRVVRREALPPEADDDETDALGVSVVYRLRTFERISAAAGDLTTGRGHQLGQSFLQILDECEAGMLPKVLYAGFDPKPYERWHFLYLEEAKTRLLEAWNMVERFDHLKELEAFGIRAFLSRRSMMLPPVRAMLGGGSDDLAIGNRIRALLGNPKKDTIVLIEDLDSDLGESAAYDHAPSKPRIVHIELDKATPLHKVLPDLVRDWHNAEPIEALGSSTEPAGLSALREQLEGQLKAIGIDEDDELRKAATKARTVLAGWADKTARSIESASEPVEQAEQLCSALNATLQSGEASIGAATGALARYSNQLTRPRRAWLSEQTRQSDSELQQSAPSLEDAENVRALAAQLIGQLSERTEQLRNASAALSALSPQFDSAEQQSDVALTRVNSVRQEIDRRAAATHTRIADRRLEALQRRTEAQAVQERLQQDRERLNQEQQALRQLQQQNERDRGANEQLREQLAQQTQRANQERADIERMRIQEIPRLEREAAEAERRLASLDPNGIRMRLAESQRRLDNLNTALSKAQAETARLGEQLRQLDEGQRQLRDKEAAQKTALADLTKASNEARRLEIALEEARNELKRARPQNGGVKARLKYAENALKKLEQMKQTRDSSFKGIFWWRS